MRRTSRPALCGSLCARYFPELNLTLQTLNLRYASTGRKNRNR